MKPIKATTPPLATSPDIRTMPTGPESSSPERRPDIICHSASSVPAVMFQVCSTPCQTAVAGSSSNERAGLRLHAEPGDAVLIAEAIGISNNFRRRREIHFFTVSLDHDRDWRSGIETDDLLNLLEAADPGAIDS